MPKSLYVVATPIGNLKDISTRAVETLKTVDLILAEDTRRTKVLLDHYGIKTPTLSLHKFNEYSRLSKIKELFEQDKSLALVSDAGTPLISDPGEGLVEYSINNKIPVIPIPGPSSLTTLLSVSGLDLKSAPPVFLGFMPHSKEKTKALLERLFSDDFTYVVFESPLRIRSLIELIRAIDQNSKIVIGRELTKIHEEILVLNPGEKLDEIKEKGEFVIAIQPSIKSNKNNKVNVSGGNSEDTRGLSKLLANYLNINQKEAYSVLLELKERFTKI